MDTLPTVAYWMDEPLIGMSRERLIEIIAELHAKNERLRLENCRRSIEHIHDLAGAAKERLRARVPWFVKWAKEAATVF